MEHLKIPWKREWQSTPVFLPGELQGQRSLMGHSPWGTKSQTQLSNFHFKLQTYMKQILKLKRIVTCFELATPLAHPGLSTVPSRPPNFAVICTGQQESLLSYEKVECV